ncbi:hypothetical protein CSA56_02655 [candidate division KSB3 bacterium]|uniref:Arsenite methyltransferase n=1 Tax=candidate division KSB3 bacterium TaxID=2044937 RepID=A0A2G6KK97_9BACT|nr:MAG: hypothetical protein CSA56_02655 [candidate division KSB3 bacterium]
MNTIQNKNEQKSMPWIAFQVMRLIMNIRKRFRNIEAEINLAGIEKGFSILDFGCGLGFNTIPAAKAVGQEGRVFALDISKQAIKIMGKKIRKNRLDNVEIIQSGCDTGLEDKSIDLVYLHNTLPMIKEKQKVLDEITRVIKTGGRLSYMSRFGSRIYGEDTISDSRLKELLRVDFTLKIERNGHVIFERIS